MALDTPDASKDGQEDTSEVDATPKSPVVALTRFQGTCDASISSVIDGTPVVVVLDSRGVDAGKEGSADDGFVGRLDLQVGPATLGCGFDTRPDKDRLECAAGAIVEFGGPKPKAKETALLAVSGTCEAELERMVKGAPVALSLKLDGAHAPDGSDAGVFGDFGVSVYAFGADCTLDTRPDPDVFACKPAISLGLPLAPQ